MRVAAPALLALVIANLGTSCAEFAGVAGIRTAPVTGPLRSAGGRALRTRDEAARRLDEWRERSALVHAALEAGDLDRRGPRGCLTVGNVGISTRTS